MSTENWQDINTGPHDASWVEVKLRDGQTWAAHWAEDLSGEEQPCFSGWFVFNGPTGYLEIRPVSWRPIDPYKMRRASGKVVCPRCRHTYEKHPIYRAILDQDVSPFLHIDCDGTLLKL